MMMILMHVGETIVECAVREVLEETGVLLRQGNGVESLMGCGTGSGRRPFPLAFTMARLHNGCALLASQR